MTSDNKFTLSIDTSGCELYSTRDIDLNDNWHHRNISFESGRIYGIISEYGQGCMYLSYLLGGNADFHDLKVTYNGTAVDRKTLEQNSLNLEPNRAAYGRKNVRKSIEKALAEYRPDITFTAEAEKFALTPERYGRRFSELSGERWRASCAYGYALGKKIFYAPYNPSGFYHRMMSSGLEKTLRELTAEGALVLLPAGSDAIMKYLADECVYLDTSYITENPGIVQVMR